MGSNGTAAGAVFLALLVVVVVVGVWSAMARERTAAQTESGVRDRTDFQTTDVFVSPLDQNGLAIDRESGQLLLIRGKRQRVLPASEIVSVEIIADERTLIKTNRGSQVAGVVVGGLLLGPVGLLIGGLSGPKRSEVRVKQLVLRVVTTSLSSPIKDVLLFRSASSRGDSKDSFLLKKPLRIAEKWHSRVSVLIHKAARSDTPAEPAPATSSFADELRKLDDLRREGVLTEGEFQEQKRRLLG